MKPKLRKLVPSRAEGVHWTDVSHDEYIHYSIIDKTDVVLVGDIEDVHLHDLLRRLVSPIVYRDGQWLPVLMDEPEKDAVTPEECGDDSEFLMIDMDDPVGERCLVIRRQDQICKADSGSVDFSCRSINEMAEHQSYEFYLLEFPK